MNSDITLEEFIALQIMRLARFQEIVQAGWADGEAVPAEEWEKRMEAVRGTVYPGEAPIQPKYEWDEEQS